MDKETEKQALENEDVPLWRESDDFYANSIHRTKGGGIGIDVGGTVFVKPLAEWHRLAVLEARGRASGQQGVEETAWLIEEQFAGMIHYFSPKISSGHEREYTNKIDEAVRFSRKEDAEIVCAWLIARKRHHVCMPKVTEHMWLAASTQSTSPAEKPKAPVELPQLVVTRGDGIPLPDQAAAIKEFMNQARLAAPPISLPPTGKNPNRVAYCGSAQPSDSVQESDLILLLTRIVWSTRNDTNETTKKIRGDIQDYFKRHGIEANALRGGT